MTYTDFLKLLGILLLCATKFSWFGVPATLAAGYSFFESVTVSISGGFIGIIFFSFLSEWLIKSTKKIIDKTVKAKPKKKFTMTNKFVVRVKRKLGLIGIAFFTPPVLSIPVGVFFAIRYYKDKTKVISYMFVSTVFWAITLYFFYKYMFDTVKAWMG